MLYLRSLLFDIVGYGILLIGCIFTSFVGFFCPRATIKIWNNFFIPIWRFCLHFIGGIKIEIRGTKYIKQSGAIYAGKHESELETYILTNFIKRATFVIKKELTYIPIFGWAQKFYGMIPVDRSAGSKAMKTMLKGALDMTRQNRPIIIFPEGTRRKPGEAPVYKPGIALLYQHLNLPVIPVATNTGLFWKKDSFIHYPGTIVLEFLPPIESGLDKKEFMQKLQDSIENKCNELNKESVALYPYVAKNLYHGDKK